MGKTQPHSTGKKKNPPAQLSRAGGLTVRNQQRTRPVNTPLLRRITRHVLAPIAAGEIGIILVNAATSAEYNQRYLGHEGSTDVITFDYAEPGSGVISGDILICIDVAVSQAEAFRTHWTEELARYVIHGILHLQGYDDLNAAARKVMKREENRLVREVCGAFPVRDLARKP